MSLVPVMDIKEGKVVMGDQGQRNIYKPVESDIVDSAEPKDVLKAFRQHYNFETVYIADIDSLENQGDNFDVIKDIFQSFDKEIMLDCGFSDYESFNSEVLSFVDKFIIPTESLKSISDLEVLLEHKSDTDFVVSIDLDEEGFISKVGDDVHSFLDKVRDLGIDEVIILDISQVGTKEGPSAQVIDVLEEADDDITVISGGGVRNEGHYKKFRSNGVDKVLVATVLHQNLSDFS